MSREITNSEAISNLNHIYGIVSSDIQRSLDVAFKAMRRPQGDLISREVLKATIIEPLNVNDAGKNDWYDGYYTAKNEDVTYIDNAPTVEFSKEICSACGRYIREKGGSEE